MVFSFLQVLHRKVLAGHDHDGRAGRESDGGEILLRVIGQPRVEPRRRAMRAHMAHHDGVAIGRGARRTGDARGAARAGDILDHHGLAKRARHVLAHDAGDHVGRATGRKRNDHGDGLGGEALGCGTRKAHEQGRTGHQNATRE
jgi:hypothetical protein